LVILTLFAPLSQLKQANLKLDKILFQLDLQLDKFATDMQISLSERCSPDTHNIQEQLQELRDRHQLLQMRQEEVNKAFNEKLEILEDKMTSLPC